MESKIAAAKIATAAGRERDHRRRAMCCIRCARSRDARSTLFLARINPTQARKRWIAGGLSAQGTIIIDAGAERALALGKEPAACRRQDRSTGTFERGDAVVREKRGRAASWRAVLVAYDAADARSLAGRRTVEIEAILGYRGRDEVIHSDDLALTSADRRNSP